MDLLTPAHKWAPRDHSDQPRTDPSRVDAAAAEPPQRMPLLQQAIMFFSVAGPILGLVAAILLLWHRGPAGIGWPEVVAMIGMYVLAGFGVTIGYHRLLTHQSFESPRALRLLFAICGSIAGQGAAIRWAATHRRHHQLSDRHGDPHSPHLHGETVLSPLRGMWHAHMGWLFYRDPPGTAHAVSDLIADPALVLIDRLYFFWVLLGLLIPAAFVGICTGTWHGVLSGLIWGGLVRICLMQHVTWSINSVCHVWGHSPFRTADHSANNWICAIFALGEGWHNNHHAFPTSARHGLKWWQFDSSWLIIWIIGRLGLARNIRTPSEAAMQMKRKPESAT